MIRYDTVTNSALIQEAQEGTVTMTIEGTVILPHKVNRSTTLILNTLKSVLRGTAVAKGANCQGETDLTSQSSYSQNISEFPTSFNIKNEIPDGDLSALDSLLHENINGNQGGQVDNILVENERGSLNISSDGRILPPKLPAGLFKDFPMTETRTEKIDVKDKFDKNASESQNNNGDHVFRNDNAPSKNHKSQVKHRDKCKRLQKNKDGHTSDKVKENNIAMDLKLEEIEGSLGLEFDKILAEFKTDPDYKVRRPKTVKRRKDNKSKVKLCNGIVLSDEDDPYQSDNRASKQLFK